ncbi:hypothetical protein [Glycomyces algeriensis]|uniref:DUF1707 domain-containing protein n=1 Tax=Glycomyces algeriensis TaxID=256037 RepID=A0A9W6LGJ2_9ACTN|nr:hypothetical protein [Glycomyces algeriensis]MDA1368009.1 hypothetical protein [Glycomyces algeriensis]MDR7349548.1 hypothetical protein [Glycomyces algeriensis]GLI42255.1 hypothetical protein GALLR39Z86_21050 [Glycomyces algeriensis]
MDAMDDAFAARPSSTDKRIALDRLATARRKGVFDAREYRLRRRMAQRARSVADLQTLLLDVGDDELGGEDHWRYGRWRGPVREGRELEIQRFVGALFVVAAIVAVIVCVSVAIVLYRHFS